MKKNEIRYRQIHLDFHTSPYIDNIGFKFEKYEFAQTLKESHVNSINLFAKCHHGMYYYPTKIGKMHPNLNFNLLGEQINVCHENGIKAIAYTCVAWNEYIAKLHPEWLCTNFEGVRGNKKPTDSSYYGWNSLCINQKPYNKLLKQEVKEIYEMCHPDGIWIDIVTGRTCICDSCLSEMKELNLDPKNINDVLLHDRYAENKFCKEFYEYIKSIDKNLSIFFNSMPYAIEDAENFKLSSRKKREYYDYIDIESLPSEQWGYAHYPVAVNYLNKYEKPTTMMNGKFHMAWGDFGTLRNQKALEYETFRAIANGSRVCIGDQLHPCGKLDKVVYKRIGKIFKSIEEKEPWLINTKKVSEVAVLISRHVTQDANPQMNSVTEEGVYRILSELHIPFDYVDYHDNLNGYKLLILPDFIDLKESMIKKINRFTKLGGKLLLTGNSAMNEINSNCVLDAIDIKFKGLSQSTSRYIRCKDDFFRSVESIDHFQYEKGYSFETDEEIIATITPPYFERNFNHFNGHCQTPPKLVTSKIPAIAKNENCIYISSPLFTQYCNSGNINDRYMLKDCINFLYPKSILKTDLPTICETTLRTRKNELIFHIVSYVIEKKFKRIATIEQEFLVYNKKVMIRTDKKPISVINVIQNKEIEFIFDGEYVQFNVTTETGHEMYSIKLV